MIAFHHANTRGSRASRLRIAHLCVPETDVMSHSLPHLTLTTSTSSLSPISSTSHIFPTVTPAHTRSLILDPYLPCDFPRQSGGSTQIAPRTGCEPKLIETEAIEPEDLETRRIELDRNLGTDPYKIQERFMRNSIAEDVDEFGKVGAEMSYLQAQMHSDCDSAESIADSDREDGELRKVLTSPLERQNREDCKTSRMSTAPGKPAAMFSSGCEEPGNQLKSSIFKKKKPLIRQIWKIFFLKVIKITCSIRQDLNS